MAALPGQIPDARAEAEYLLQHVLECTRSSLYAWPETPIDVEHAETLDSLLARRLSGEPLAYLTGSTEFFGRSFRVGPDVLIPRDDTDVLVELGLQYLATDVRPENPVILDLGTGSGAVAITIAVEAGVPVTATDLSAAALQVATRNAARLVPEQVDFLQADWLDAFSDNSAQLILSNPPYVADSDPHLEQLAFEPMLALVGGSAGYDAIERIIAGAQRVGSPGCPVIIEHGHKQGEAVRERMRCAHLVNVRSAFDLAGRERVTLGHVAKEGS